MANAVIRRCIIYRRNYMKELLKVAINDCSKATPHLYYCTQDKDVNKMNTLTQDKQSRKSNTIKETNTNKPKFIEISTHCKDSSKILESLNISTRMIGTLGEVFNIRPYKALNLLENNKKIKSLSTVSIKEGVELCREFEIPDKAIMNYLDVLVHQDLRDKLVALKELPYPLHRILALANIKTIALQKFISRFQEEQFPNMPGKRIQFIAELLNETTEFVCEALVKMDFLRSKNLDKMTEDYKMILGG